MIIVQFIFKCHGGAFGPKPPNPLNLSNPARYAPQKILPTHEVRPYVEYWCMGQGKFKGMKGVVMPFSPLEFSTLNQQVSKRCCNAGEMTNKSSIEAS